MQRGMQLASVLSATENELLVIAAEGHIVWIGGTDEDSEGTWKWSSGTPVMENQLSYTNWRSGEPNNHGNEDCIRTYNGAGEWIDDKCYDKWWYVCERRA